MTADRARLAPSRARPLVDPAVEAVLGQAQELARRWILALIRARPLETVEDLPLAELAHEAPLLCEQMLRAVQSDLELPHLTGEGAAEGRDGAVLASLIGEIVGARDAAGVVWAVEALRGVLWEALLDELSVPTARQVGDLGDRLAYVCALAAAVASASPGRLGRAAAPPPAEPAPGSGARSSSSTPRQQAILVDELARTPIAERGPPAPRTRAQATPIEIRDVRGMEGPAAWMSSIGAQLERFARDQRPFAVLLVEIGEHRRVPVGGSDASGLRERTERALVQAIGARGSVTRERHGRYWLVMADADHAGARRVAQRIALEAASGAGEPPGRLEVAVGVAVCPEDGHEASALAAHADVGLYADRSVLRARAAGGVAPEDG